MTEQDTFDTLRRIPRPELEKNLGLEVTRKCHFIASSTASQLYQRVSVNQTIRRGTVFTSTECINYIEDFLIESNRNGISKKFLKTGWTVEDYINHLIDGYIKRLEHNRKIDYIVTLLFVIYFSYVFIAPVFFVESVHSLAYVTAIILSAVLGILPFGFAVKRNTSQYISIKDTFKKP